MRYGYLIIFALVVAYPPTAIFAQSESTSTATSTESGGIFSDVLDTVNEFRQDVQETVLPQDQSVLSERTQKRIINLAANISNRLDGISDRMTQIAGRLEKRIEKQSSEGYDVTAARNSLAAAKTALETARQDLSTIDRKVLAVVGSPNPKTAWIDVRATYIIARDNIKIAHSELRNTIGNLKSATQPPAQTEAATSTESSETTQQ